MAQVTIPNVLANGPTNIVDAVQLNANFSTIYTAFNTNVDNTNIGPAGLFVSSLIPSTIAEATFGGTQAIVFPNGLSSTSVKSGTGYCPPVYTASGLVTAATEHIVRLSGSIPVNNGSFGGLLVIALSGAGAFTAASSYIAVATITGTNIGNALVANLVITQTSGTSISVAAELPVAASSTGVISFNLIAIGD